MLTHDLKDPLMKREDASMKSEDALMKSAVLLRMTEGWKTIKLACRVLFSVEESIA